MAKERGKEWEEYDNAVRWITMTFFISIAVSIVLLYLSHPIAYLIQQGISKKSLSVVIMYIKKTVSSPEVLYNQYAKWFKKAFSQTGSTKLSSWIPILPFISFPVILITGAIKCPYKFQSNVHGSAHIATLRDIERMPLLGFDGFCMVVGRFQGKC